MYLVHINLKKTFHDVQFMGDLIMCLDCHCVNFEIDHELKRTQNTCEVNTIQFSLDTFIFYGVGGMGGIYGWYICMLEDHLLT